jgi:hypothetical protein
MVTTETLEPAAGFPEFRPEAGQIFIYPPWAEFSRKWRDLPELFLSPEKWGPDFNLPHLKGLGYTVFEHDHRFFDGPRGGGLIQVFRDSHRWFPAVLFTREASYYSPMGFPRIGMSPVVVIVPRMSDQQRFFGEAVPKAPSPHISVEQLPEGMRECVVALGVSKRYAFDDSEFLLGYTTLDLKLERLQQAPENARDVFAGMDDPRLTWHWYSIQHPGLTPCLWAAAVIYLGLRLADLMRGKIRDMHIFTSEFVPGTPFPSARLWTSRKSKGIVLTADDW